jgi:DNA replication protein DnaC
LNDIRNEILSCIPKLPLKGDEIEIGGVPCCPVCHEPRITRVKYGGREHIHRCICPCESEEVEHATLKQQITYRQQGIKDKQYLSYTFENSEIDLPIAKKYCDNWGKYYEGNIGLQFMGEPGNGKTYIAACIANRLINDGHTVLMANVLWYLEQLHFKNDNSAEFLNSLQNYDLMIIDDFGAMRESEYRIEQMYNIIDTRYRAKKPLIITTNLSLEDYKNETNMNLKRIYDRLSEMCHPITIKTESWRKKTGNERFKNLNTELGIT